jgi:Trk K+ transport system NAD-binding subunit
MEHSRRSLLVQAQRKQFSGFQRRLRATWHDTLALWREFRLPVCLFLLVIFGGGFVYGELYYAARGDYIALIDRPYIMMQLMILETPEEAPPEWYLVAFWYALPPIFVLLVGLGAADFVRLFFFRSQRHDAWREAVAGTYRNHIIVFGAGHVGLRVVRELAEMGVDVLVIDNDPDPGVEDTLKALNVALLTADGRLSTTLEKAGLPYADGFVACTGSDHTNLEAVMRARDMNPEVRIVTRVWDDDFAKQIARFLNVQSVLSSSGLSAPAFAGAALGVEITQTLQVGSVEYSMIRLTVQPGTFMDGAEVGALQTANDMDIVLHRRGDTVDVQPARHTRVQAGDLLVIFASHETILNVVARNRRPARK